MPVIRNAYRPAAEDIHWANSVLVAAQTERGVFAFDGRMVDAPLLRHAEAIIRRSTSISISRSTVMGKHTIAFAAYREIGTKPWDASDLFIL